MVTTSTTIRFNKSKPAISRIYLTKKWLISHKKQARRQIKNQKVKKFIYIALSFGLFIISGISAMFLWYLQSITNQLPSPDKPFGSKNIASEIYDRNGTMLYRVFGDENRDPVKLDDVPPLLVWSFLAAEDIDFYQHIGVDFVGVGRCLIINIANSGVSCGGSTITQQLIKQTALTNERKIERKIKELILALQIEQIRSKEEILEMYLTVAPEGSNIYSVTSASKFYFGKELKQLNLAEMAILAAIPQNPSQLSPTKSANPEIARKELKIRQEYVLDQMLKYIDKINQEIGPNPDGTQALTMEMIDKARKVKVKYADPRFNIAAPHFVFYAEKLLQQRNYNNGEPFTLSDLETGGYKIWTTLDYDMQQIAEEQVKKGVESYGSRFGGENASLVALNPKNGEVLAMVGSKDYFGKPSPEGCTLGVDCKFEPNVNISDTLQSYGSSMKPMAYYLAMIKGLISPASQLADIPIKIGQYSPKNYEGGFTGIHDARWMLSQSRNIPAIYLVDQMGVDTFVKEMQKWGYTTLDNPNGYGPSIIVGGGDVKLIDHAQAYAVLANEGKYTKHEVILKIEDKFGNVIYQANPKSKKVADPRGVYLVNHILNGKYDGPGLSWDGRDVAGKTGTSEAQKETLFATYTPEIVVIGWLGNNNNASMRYGASGFTSARPWISEFLQRVGDKIPATAFVKPDGIGYSGGDYVISGIKVPNYKTTKEFLVCVDQPNRLARPIDIDMGKAMLIEFPYYLMPNPKMQAFLDAWINFKGTTYPTKYCNIDRTTPTPTPTPIITPFPTLPPTITPIVTPTLSPM